MGQKSWYESNRELVYRYSPNIYTYIYILRTGCLCFWSYKKEEHVFMSMWDKILFSTCYHNKSGKIHFFVFFPWHPFCLLFDSHCRFMTPQLDHNRGLKRRPAVILSDSSFSLSLWPWQPVTVRRGTQHKVTYRLLFFESLLLAHKNDIVSTEGNLQSGRGCERYLSKIVPYWKRVCALFYVLTDYS